MACETDLLNQAIVRLAGVEGVLMDPDALAEDVFLLSVSFPEETDFLKAVLATERALCHVASGRVTGGAPRNAQRGWFSYHHRQSIAQGSRAVMRLEWQPVDDGRVRVRGFGHRWIPSDFYRRMSDARNGAV